MPGHILNMTHRAPSVSNNLLSGLYVKVCEMRHIPMYTNQTSLNNIICNWYPTSGILDLYLWDLWHNILSYSPLTYDICATVLNHLTCLFSSFHPVSSLCCCEGNLGCINSAYDDLRYVVYIYEGFLIWIIPLTYQSHESIIWACTTSFVQTCIYRMLNISSHVYLCLCSRHNFWYMFSIVVFHVLTWFLVRHWFHGFSSCFWSLPVPVCLNHIT